MKKLIMSTVMALSVFSTAVAFAGPPARETPAPPCRRCVMNGNKSANVALPHTGQYGLGEKPCRHGAVAANVRWGTAQKPCPHCNHAG